MIAGRRINNLHYKDTTLIAECEQKMAELIERMEEENLKFELRLKCQKTTLMTVK